MAEGINLIISRKPYILRPERVGQMPWLSVLKDLGISRGNPGWVDSFVSLHPVNLT